MPIKNPVTKESNLHQQVVDYLKYQYPKVLFRTDFAAGIKMTIGQAMKHKKIQKCKSWPDIFIAKPVGCFNGLFIELKTNQQQVYTKTGKFKTPHVKDQYFILEELYKQGYCACFAFGFDNAKDIVDDYLNYD